MRETIATLRKKVLTLAVSGQLVQQYPSEGTGEELYQAIQKARTEAAKTATGRKKNTKPLPPITLEEIPFEIPESWKWVRLGKLTEMQNGYGFSKNQWSTEGVPIIRIQNLTSTDAPFNFSKDVILNEKYKVSEDDLLLSWSGTPGTSFGIFIWNRGNGVLNQHIFRVDLETLIDKVYFKLVGNYRIYQVLDTAHGGVGLKHLTKPQLESLILPIPPLAEQCRIVAKVEEIMQTLDLLEQEANDVESMLDLLEKRILTEAVSGKLVPQDPSEGTGEELYQAIQKARTEAAKTATGRKKNTKPLPPITPDEIPFDIPQSWKWVRLGEIVEVQTGKLDANAASDNGQYPFFTCADAPLKIDRYAYDTECVLLAGNGNFNVKYYRGKFEAYQRTYIIEPASDGIFVPYLYYLVQMNIERYKNTSLGSTMPFIRLAYITEAMAPLPPLAEQRRIVAKVDEAMSLIKHLREAIS